MEAKSYRMEAGRKKIKVDSISDSPLGISVEIKRMYSPTNYDLNMLTGEEHLRRRKHDNFQLPRNLNIEF